MKGYANRMLEMVKLFVKPELKDSTQGGTGRASTGTECKNCRHRPNLGTAYRTVLQPGKHRCTTSVIVIAPHIAVVCTRSGAKEAGHGSFWIGRYQSVPFLSAPYLRRTLSSAGGEHSRRTDHPESAKLEPRRLAVGANGGYASSAPIAFRDTSSYFNTGCLWGSRPLLFLVLREDSKTAPGSRSRPCSLDRSPGRCMRRPQHRSWQS